MMNSIKRFVREEEGVTMVEYGLIAALIAVVCVVAIQSLGTNLNTAFELIRDCIRDRTAAACS